MEKVVSQILFIGSGVFISLQLLCGGFCIGLLMGTLLSVARYNGIAVWIINGFVSLVRGTPLMLQLSIVYFAVPTFCGCSCSLIMAGVVTFGLNSSAYIAEILRSGIQSVPKGQFEAAKTLRIPSFYLWKDIILPQVLRNVFPALINEVIALLKETALIATIGGTDIMRKSQMVAAEQFTYFMPLCIAGCYYYVLVLCIAYIGKKIERGFLYGNY